MIPEIAKIYSDKIRDEMLRRFGTGPDRVRELDGFESYVYVIPFNGREVILKVTHSMRRTVDYIMGEIDFVGYLAGNGVPVPRPVESIDGNPVEVLHNDDGSYFLAYAFEKFDGIEPKYENRNVWKGSLFEKWGRLAGRMNTLAKEYRVAKWSYKRQQWYEDDVLKFEKYIPASQAVVIDKCNAMLEKLKTLPRDGETYGLIHGDMHQGNFLVDNGRIRLFDFDDCEYHYYVNEIAVSLYYATPPKRICDDQNAFAKKFMRRFLKGYRDECTLDPEWLAHIPDFLKFRDMLLHSVLCQAFIGENLTDKWRESMKRREHNIANDIPVLNIDFIQEFHKLL